MNKTTILVFAATLFASAAQAAPVTLNEVDKGWYTSNGTHITSNQNYIVGTDGPWRNFFVFDLSSVTGSITSAELRLDNPSGTADSGTYTLWSYEGSITSLLNGTGGSAAYADLGDGTLFSSTFLTGSTGTKVLSLNGAALSALAGATGQFVLGGDFTGGVLFPSTHVGDPDTQLVLNVEAAVPTPGALALLGFGLFGLGLRRRTAR